MGTFVPHAEERFPCSIPSHPTYHHRLNAQTKTARHALRIWTNPQGYAEAWPIVLAMTSTTCALGAAPRVFRVRDLERLGVSQSSSYRRARADGPWCRLLPGIVLTAPGPPTTDDLIEAALLRAGPGAMVTGMHAARLHGLKTPPSDAPVHILIPHHRKLQNHAGVRFERTTRLPEPVYINGVPTAPLVRAVMDAARSWQPRAVVEEILVEAIQSGKRCHPHQLKVEMELGSRRGTGLPREILRSLTAHVRSVPELRAFELVERSGLPAPMWNARIYDAEGSYIGCPDAWFDDVGLAVEIDSFDFHYSRYGYANTVRRNTRYAMQGISVIQILPSRIRAEPEAVVADIRRAYLTAADRQRPNVVARRALLE